MTVELMLPEGQRQSGCDSSVILGPLWAKHTVCGMSLGAEP